MIDSKHAALKKQLESVLSKLNIELLNEDQVIADVLLSTEKHLTAQELLVIVSRKHKGIDLTHVRRVLRQLVEVGVVRKTILEDRTVFEHMHPGEHHDHMICLRCGKIDEFLSPTIEDAQLAVCHESGFQPLLHTLVIRGVCKGCANEIPTNRALSSCLSGEKVAVTDVVGDDEGKRRLMDMGFVRKAEVQVIRNDGPLAVDIKGSRVALDRQQAARIMVTTQGND